MRLLLIEDDPQIAAFVSKGFGEAGCHVTHAADGIDGLAQAVSVAYDVAIVDLMLPGLDGLSVIDRMRRRRIDLPVLILSAKRSVDERVRGLQAGGDDYLTKPFAFTELLARVQALVRRANRVTDPAGISVGDLVIDSARHEVTRAGRRIVLQPREFALLEYLALNTGRVVTRTMIMERVWDYHFDPGTNVVESRICRLREKVDRDFPVPLIHTVRGVGYVLKSAG